MGNDRSGRMTDNRELHTMEMTASGGWKTIGNCKTMGNDKQLEIWYKINWEL